MLKYNNLEFFTKNGNACNFEYDTELNKWLGSIFIPKISVGLFETEHIFIYERLINNNSEYYAKPHINTLATSQDIQLKWETDTTPELTLYTVDDSTINKLTILNVTLDYSPSDTCINNQIHTNLITNEYIQIDVAINSEIDGVFENNLLIIDTNDGHVIADIRIYSEVEGEDERLKTLCNNLPGNDLTQCVLSPNRALTYRSSPKS